MPMTPPILADEDHTAHADPNDSENSPFSSDRIDLSERYTRSVLEVPMAWLDLTPPSDSLHLKLMEGHGAHRVDIWSSGVPLDEQMAWARSQGGWDIGGEYHARSFVVSLAVDSPPEGLAWLAQLSSYQRLDLHPDGTVHVHLAGPRQDIQEVQRRLRRATDVEVVHVADAEDEDPPLRDPPLATA